MGGRYQITRQCCQIRLLATMPAHARAIAYEDARKNEGTAAMEALKARVSAEWKRLNAARRATAAAAINNIKEFLKAPK